MSIVDESALRTDSAAPSASFIIRGARCEDAAEIARLAGVLGYPNEADAMHARLQRLEGHADHWVAVAVASREEPLRAPIAPRAPIALGGWVHVARCTTLQTGDYAEILGLVVDRGARRGGVGRQLVAAAERWGRERALSRMMVRSNAARSESHAFYAALGYARPKTQHVYLKTLSGAGGD